MRSACTRLSWFFSFFINSAGSDTTSRRVAAGERASGMIWHIPRNSFLSGGETCKVSFLNRMILVLHRQRALREHEDVCFATAGADTANLSNSEEFCTSVSGVDGRTLRATLLPQLSS